jgi:hypothetical protein
MAAEDSAVTLNPYAGLTPDQQQSVATNEASRLRMRDTGAVLGFPVTPEQRQFFEGSAYASQPQMMRHTIAARILAGDQSAGPYTPAQKAAAENVLSGLLLDR